MFISENTSVDLRRLIGIVASPLESPTQRSLVVHVVDRSVERLVEDVLQPPIHVGHAAACHRRRCLVVM